MANTELKDSIHLSINEIQGVGLISPFSGQNIVTRGVITGRTKRGFFIQTPNVTWDGKRSDAIYVHSPTYRAELQLFVEIKARVVDYLKHETARPVTQLHFEDLSVLDGRDTDGNPPVVTPILFTQALLGRSDADLAILLNSLEGMLIEIASGQTFIAPSNHHGDYVLALDSPNRDDSIRRSSHGGVIPNIDQERRWFPGFRINNYNHAPRVNVGAKLAKKIVAPLNYRADSYQLAVEGPIEVEPNFISPSDTKLRSSVGNMTVMTLNCFNLDPHVESEAKVINPRMDIDDDVGEGRFHSLARAVVLQAKCPDIVALQEIQDNDGAEQSNQVDASDTYRLLVELIKQASGIEYKWTDVAPMLDADGGQPGGNIRNGFLYNANRVTLESDSVGVIGQELVAFEGSRKPLQATFREIETNKQLTCINVHLASKRHQASIFAPLGAGIDLKESVRHEQASSVARVIKRLAQQGKNYYVTGDFNDTQDSETLRLFCADHSENLVYTLDESQRFDYNHRGKLQVLMHGIVAKGVRHEGASYEIIHGNELIGVQPGEETDKASDHAYVIAKLPLR